MPAISTAAKAKLGTKAAKGVMQRPGAALMGARAAKPVAKRRARKRIGSIGDTVTTIGDTARTYGELLVNYGPSAAQELGLAQKPRSRRTAPRVAAGVVLGAGAMYFLEPEHGAEHREKARQLVG